jgi:predicted nucleotidyltransferase
MRGGFQERQSVNCRAPAFARVFPGYQDTIHPQQTGGFGNQQKRSTGLHDQIASALQALGKLVEVAFVFGSVASATESANSDVDVMVIGDVTFGQVVHALYDLQAQLGREINPEVMTRQEWQSKLDTGNVFVAEVMKKPMLFVVGSADEL